jgi:hypothetical protein
VKQGRSRRASTGEFRARVVSALARESLVVVVCATLLGLLALFAPVQLSSDGWLALVGGRAIISNGLPHHDTLAALTSGRSWTDQQWLGLVALYGLHALGGVRLLLAVNVALVSGAFVAAAAFARRGGAHPSTVAWVGLLVGLPFLVSTLNVRTQSLVYLPFVAVVYVLTRSRIDLRRALLLLGTLVLWANVHGSVLLAAALVVLRGAVGLWESRGVRRERFVLWLLVVAPFPCILASPYHVHLLAYYQRTAFNPSFSKYLSQWAPTSFSPISAPLIVALFLTTLILARPTAGYSLYERWALGLALVLGLLAVRNWAFATLLVLMLVPVGFDRSLRRRPASRAPAFGAAIGAAAGGLAIFGSAAALAVPAAKLTHNYAAGAGDAAASAVFRTGAPVYGGIAYSDWLLWEHPDLSGRVVLDARYELLHPSEVKRVVLFSAGSGLNSPLGRPRVYVLDRNSDQSAIEGLRGAVRIVYKTDQTLVAVSRQPE